MDLGIRFSSPTLDEKDFKLLSEKFDLESGEMIDIIENAPYEISILVSLLQKIYNKIEKIKQIWIW